jgi:hypothetical protein
VKDADGDWGGGTVEGFEMSEEGIRGKPLVVREGFTTAYTWDSYRPLGPGTNDDVTLVSLF